MDAQKNAPKRVTLFIWIANVVMVIFALAFILVIVVATQFPRLADHSPNLTGATQYAFTASTNFLGVTYWYDFRMDDPEIGPVETLVRIDRDRMFRFSPKDSVMVSLGVRDEERSQSTSGFGGLVQRSVNVYQHQDVPLLVGHPGTPITATQMRSEIWTRSTLIGLTLLYLIVVTWYIRGFAAGLRSMKFFSEDNLRKLTIAGWMLTVGPILSSIFGLLFLSGIEDVYSGATLWEHGLTLNIEPVIMVFGLLLLAISWCFRYGVELQQEQEYTI